MRPTTFLYMKMTITVYRVVQQSPSDVPKVSYLLKGQAFWNLMLRRARRVVSDVSRRPSAISFIVKIAFFLEVKYLRLLVKRHTVTFHSTLKLQQNLCLTF